MPVTGDRSYAEALARLMHPDLEWPKPNDDVKNRLSRFQIVDQLDDLQRVYECPEIDVNADSISTTIYCSEWGFVGEGSERKYQVIEGPSLEKMAKNMKALKELGADIVKDYGDSYFHVFCTFKSGLKITLTVGREAICKKKVVGTEYVPPAKGYYKEIVEWDCEPVSLMEL